MNLTEQIYAQALTMAGALDDRQGALLRALCRSACAMLAGQLKSGVDPEVCRQDFVTAAGLMALAAMSEAGEAEVVERFTAGDVSIHKSRSLTAAECLRKQARGLMAPWLKDDFAFMGV